MKSLSPLYYVLCFVIVIRKRTKEVPSLEAEQDNKFGYSLSSCWVLGWSPLTQRVDCPSQCTDTPTDYFSMHRYTHSSWNIAVLFFKIFPGLISMCLPSGANSVSQSYWPPYLSYQWLLDPTRCERKPISNPGTGRVKVHYRQGILNLGNHSCTTSKLRMVLQMNAGDWFNKGKHWFWRNRLNITLL